MSLWKIAWRSIQQRALASTLTAVAMGLGVALVVAVLVIHEVVDHSFRRGGEGYDVLVGAKGGKLQLVLNSAYFLGSPVGTIPYSYRDDIIDGYVDPEVIIESAVPISTGHSYGEAGHPVVGTTPEMFTVMKYLGDREYAFDDGDNFAEDDPLGAVIGARIAREERLGVGDTFSAVHGLLREGGHPHEENQFKIVGVLEHTGTPADRALFVNIKGFSKLHGGSGDEASMRVTAILVCVDPMSYRGGDMLAKTINKGDVAQAAIPIREIRGLFENIVGNIQMVLLLFAVLIVVVAGIGIMVSIYNSMSDRRHEIAVMRALGASRLTVMTVILLESILLSLFGGAIGLLLGHGLIWGLSPVIFQQTGVAVGPLQFRLIELVLIPGLIALASMVGYLPAKSAYRTDVAQSLTATQ